MTSHQSVDLKRRSFLTGQTRRQLEPVFRLPWVRDEQTFISQCTQCQHCVDACETHIIKRDPLGFPYVDFKQGECTFCARCVDTCEQDMFLDHKKTAAWNTYIQINETCLANQQVYCQSCREVCEQSAITFPLSITFSSPPEINSDLCNACGACISICPQDAIVLSPKSDSNDD